ncbi:MAG: putative 4-hydroxybenzoate polyprenyltransferase [Saprospiraceae bacterium]|nr:putative 4-hydroxybenzoate polyprenyltransferase [Saprospiraceae bacterium]
MLRKYLSLVKFSHTIFALPFAAVGFTLGVLHSPQAALGWLGLKVLLCMVFARNTAMAFNRLVDAEIDKLNPRTSVREIPAGVLESGQVKWFVLVNVVLFILTTSTINTLCFALSPVALIVIMGYSYTKRVTPLCHVILGVGLALAPVGAFMAVTGQINLPVLLLGFSVLCWVGGFDVIYALQDEHFDNDHDLYSLPSWLGGSKALMISRGLHILSFLCLAGFAWTTDQIFDPLSWMLFLAVAGFSGLLVFQHRLVKPEDLSKVNMAFFTTNGIASLSFGALTVLALVLGS